MKIYPPFKNWTIEIKNPHKFHIFMVEHVETHHTNQKARLKGSLNSQGFNLERKLGTHNTARPRIKGEIKSNEEGKQILTMTIVSPLHLLIAPVVAIMVTSILAIYNSSTIFFLIIPVILIWFYLGGLLLHLLELKKTKLELNNLLRQASII